MSIDFYFVRVRDVKPPVRGTAESAGIDFFVPNDFQRRQLLPGESVLIPSGIKCAYPPGYAFVFFNKSGVATKRMLTALACVCDSDYHGELHISLCNVGINAQEIVPGEKIAQFLLLPIETFDPVEANGEDELWNRWSMMRGGASSERGEGGFGSTGTE